MEIVEFFAKHWAPIVGAVLVASLAAYLAWRNNYKTRRANACATFRSAVLGQLGDLYPMPSSWPQNIDGYLRQRFGPLQQAVAAFRPFVPKWRRSSYDAAWATYRCSTGREIDVQVYHHYMGFHGDPDPKETFRRNVDRILSFASDA